MIDRRLLWTIPAIAVFLVAARPDQTWLAEHWTNPDAPKRTFRKVMIVGITDDLKVRHHFEDKFVSHLRSRRIQAITSHSLVPDLGNIEAEDEIRREMASQEVDAVITVRLVSLDKSNEAGLFARS